MKTITHAQLVEGTKAEPKPLTVSADVGRADTGIVLVFSNGVERIYYPESVKVRQALDQIKIIGVSLVRFTGIGPEARIHRVAEPPEPEVIEDPPEAVPEPVAVPKLRPEPIRPNLPSWQGRGTYRGPSRARRFFAWVTGRKILPPYAEPMDGWIDSGLEGEANEILMCLTLGAGIAEEFEAIYGRPLTEHDRALGITLYLTEQRKRGNHDR